MMSDWKKYTASNEQIKELNSAIGSSDDGVLLKFKDGTQRIVTCQLYAYDFVEYLIIPDDPLREMKIQQARTGQPVWAKEGKYHKHPFIYETNDPNWSIPNAEYSFTEFKEEV